MNDSDKQIGSKGVIVNEQQAEKFHKPITTKFKTRKLKFKMWDLKTIFG